MNNKACQNSWNGDYLKLIKYLWEKVLLEYIFADNNNSGTN